MYFTSKPFRIVKQNSKYLNWKINFDSRFFFFIEYVILLDLTPLLLTNCAVYIYIYIYIWNKLAETIFREKGISNRGNLSFFCSSCTRNSSYSPIFIFFLLFCSRFSPSPLPSHLFFNVDASFFFFFYSFFFLEKTRLQKCLICSRQACWNFSNIREISRSSPLRFALIVITLFYR